MGMCTDSKGNKPNHGMFGTPEHGSWAGMKQRCLNPNNHKYPRYGGRGIKICPEWMDFENFFRDMGLKPGPKYTLGRINNDGDYEASNCRWETSEQQQRNTSTNRLLTFKGKTKTVAEWAEGMGVHPDFLHNRLRRGWSVKDTLIKPARKRRK